MTILILGNINHVYADVSGVHDLLQIPWQPEVAADPQAVYGVEVEATLGSSYGIKVESDLESSYSLRPVLAVDSYSVYSIRVESDTGANYGVKVECDVQAFYTVGTLYKDTGCRYSLRAFVYSDTLSTYGINLHYDYGDVESPYSIKVESDTGSEYAIRNSIYSDVGVSYQLISYVENDLEAVHNISPYTLVYKDIRGVYMLYSPSSETIVTQVSVTVNDE